MTNCSIGALEILFIILIIIIMIRDGVCRIDSGQFDSARSYGSGKDVALAGMKESMYGVGNLQSSPAMKTFYNKALLSTAGSDMVQDFPLVCNTVILLC